MAATATISPREVGLDDTIGTRTRLTKRPAGRHLSVAFGRAALLATVLALIGAALWGLPGYLRFAHEYRDFLALIRGLPDVGVCIDDERATLDQLDALLDRGGAPPDVLYLNDSTMGSGEESTAALLAGLTRLKVAGVSGAGFTPPIYVPILEALAARRGPPKRVLFQVNLRSFSSCGPFHGIYYEHLRRYLDMRQYDVARDYLACLAAGNTSAASFYGHRYQRAGQDYPEFFTRWERDRDAEIARLAETAGRPLAPLAADFYSAYCRPIGPDHPMLAATAGFIRLAKAAGASVTVYATPVNMAEGVRLWGSDFTARVKANLAEVRQAVTAAGAPFIDLSELLGDQRFIDRDYANEHVDLEGRKTLAHALARALAREPAGR